MFQKRPPLTERRRSFFAQNFRPPSVANPMGVGGRLRNRSFRGLTKTPNLSPPERIWLFCNIPPDVLGLQVAVDDPRGVDVGAKAASTIHA